MVVIIIVVEIVVILKNNVIQRNPVDFIGKYHSDFGKLIWILKNLIKQKI